MVHTGGTFDYVGSDDLVNLSAKQLSHIYSRAVLENSHAVLSALFSNEEDDYLNGMSLGAHVSGQILESIIKLNNALELPTYK